MEEDEGQGVVRYVPFQGTPFVLLPAFKEYDCLYGDDYYARKKQAEYYRKSVRHLCSMRLWKRPMSRFRFAILINRDATT